MQRRLDRRITIQRKTVNPSDSGEPVEIWSSLSDGRWATVSPLRGDERFNDAQYVAREQVELEIRWSQSVADLSPQDRIIFPAIDQPAIPDTRVYDILAVHEIGRREGLRIIAVRRADL